MEEWILWNDGLLLLVILIWILHQWSKGVWKTCKFIRESIFIWNAIIATDVCDAFCDTLRDARQAICHILYMSFSSVLTFLFRRYNTRPKCTQMCPFDLAVLIVNYPFPINNFIRPACLPPMRWSWKLKGGNMVISGMGKTPYHERSPYMQIATIPMKSKHECYDNLNAIQKTSQTRGLVRLAVRYDRFRGEIVVLWF